MLCLDLKPNAKRTEETRRLFARSHASSTAVSSVPESGSGGRLALSGGRPQVAAGMVAATEEMAVYCFDALVAHYSGDQPPPPAFEEGIHPLFVTWKKATNGSEPRLRGCIGTLEARQIVTGFREYALTSALRDRRFPPIQSKELPYLECTVSILTEYETALNHLDWEVGKHGLIIEFTDPDYNMRRSATYLPEVAAHEGWTHLETIDSLMRKAGYDGTITESLRKKIQVTRYQSTLYTMHYGEYAAYVKKNRGVAPAINGAPVVNGFKPGY
ncbi:hypothetical protein ABZP36_012720 [Zizania latifolia]